MYARKKEVYSFPHCTAIIMKNENSFLSRSYKAFATHEIKFMAFFLLLSVGSLYPKMEYDCLTGAFFVYQTGKKLPKMAFTSTPFLCTSTSSTSSSVCKSFLLWMKWNKKINWQKWNNNTCTQSKFTYSLTNTLNRNFYVQCINFIWILKGGIFVHIYYYLLNKK